jgi:hypothetical protein
MMISRLYLFLALASACFGTECAEPTDRIELWLASTKSCNACGIYERVAVRRGYGDTLTYVHDGKLLRLPIHRVDKNALATTILSQLSGDFGPASPYWSINLVVIVVRDGRVLYAGNIAESADIRRARYSDEEMTPPRNPSPNHPALKDGGEYERFFFDNWNLEYFAALALGDATPRGPIDFIDLDDPHPVLLTRSNIILWGAAEKPLKNAAFIAQRIREIRASLETNLSPPLPKFITLYGGDHQNNANDTSAIVDGQVQFFRADVNADLSATAEGIGSVLTAIKRSEDSRSLLIHVGHSGPAGAPLWGQLGTLQPQDLHAVGSNKLIMVSGGCHSGLFARAVQCGFFAAHPEVIATGCEKSASAIESADDYLRLFFSGITSKGRGTDSNRDGKISLSEAHWYASARIEDHQLSYTTVDALADNYFAADVTLMPKTMTVSAIRRLVTPENGATPEEVKAMQSLTATLRRDEVIALSDAVARNHAAQKVLVGSTELSSDDRNRIIKLPYKLMLPMIARRVLYRSKNSSNNELHEVTACEAQSIAQFLKNSTR